MTTPRTGDTITTPEQLGALPNRTAIHDANRELWERNGTILDHLLEEGHAAWVGTTGGLCHSLEIDLPATVLYVPDEQPRPSVTNDARAALSEIRSIIEANLVQGDYEAWHERPDDTLDAIWDALNRAETTTEDIQTLDARWFERWETEQPLADKYAGYYQGRVSAIAQCREELRHMLAAARAETTTDDPHDGDGNRLTPDWQPETTTATVEDAAWEVIARVRDAHPRVNNDAPTDEIVAALADAGLLATARTLPTREQIVKVGREHAVSYDAGRIWCSCGALLYDPRHGMVVPGQIPAGVPADEAAYGLHFADAVLALLGGDDK